MNTVLDLIGEFGLLNDAKGIWGEKFPPESERRWRELKDFYDLLMSKSGIGPRPVVVYHFNPLSARRRPGFARYASRGSSKIFMKSFAIQCQKAAPRPVTRRFTAKEVEEKVTARERLRVPLENEMIFRAGSEFHAAMGVNLSRGGVFLTSPVILPIHTKLNVYLSSPDVSHEALLEAEAEVAWTTSAEDASRDGMGLSFLGDMGEIIRHLDALVINSLVRRLSGVDANSLAPDFLLKEALEL